MVYDRSAWCNVRNKSEVIEKRWKMMVWVELNISRGGLSSRKVRMCVKGSPAESLHTRWSVLFLNTARKKITSANRTQLLTNPAMFKALANFFWRSHWFYKAWHCWFIQIWLDQYWSYRNYIFIIWWPNEISMVSNEKGHIIVKQYCADLMTEAMLYKISLEIIGGHRHHSTFKWIPSWEVVMESDIWTELQKLWKERGEGTIIRTHRIKINIYTVLVFKHYDHSDYLVIKNHIVPCTSLILSFSKFQAQPCLLHNNPKPSWKKMIQCCTNLLSAWRLLHISVHQSKRKKSQRKSGSGSVSSLDP